NDTYGHQTGDQVLRLVGMAVKQTIKGRDIPCRYGGEEFAVLLPDTGIKQAAAVAENIRKTIANKELIKKTTGDNLGRVTISIGVAEYRAGDNSQAIIERADSCLYAAKEGGRNKVVIDTETQAEQAQKAPR
ncbi:hypothetical protein CAPTEDRAFT_144359, partial [Capitella teleta]